MAGTVWAPLRSPQGAFVSIHLVSVQLPLWTLVAYPMYKLHALKFCVVRIYAILGIALMVPLTQQSVFRCLKCRMAGLLDIAAAATRASTVVLDPLCYLSLPFMLAVWTLPVSSGVAASKCLLGCLDILAVIPIS